LALEQMANRSPFDEFVRASAHHLSALLIGQGSGMPPAGDQARREAHLAQAMDALRRAITGGYRTVDPQSFTALESRPDFQDLMRDLRFPEWPFAGDSPQ
jgi:hypothetical protein